MTETLFDSPDNPLPNQASAGAFVTRDGKRIRYALFPATGRPFRGTIILLQGRNETIEKYFETARDLQAKGFGIATFDLRGQGGSQRLARNPRAGHVRRFDHYVADLEQFFDDIVLPDCRAPFFLLGHSTGGLVALLAAQRLYNRVRRIVLCAPLLDFAGLPLSTPKLRRLTGFLRMVGAGALGFGRASRAPASFANNVLTSDPTRFARNCGIYERHPELAIGAPTMGWLNAACVAIARATSDEFLAGVRVPVLMIGAGADEVVSTRAIEYCARRMRSGVMLAIDGARHEIFQEADIYREQILAATEAFMLDEERSGV